MVVNTFKYLDEITGDAEFIVKASSLDELLEEAGRALVGLMYNIKKLNSNREIELEISGSNEEELVYNWLTEILSQQDIENVFFKDFRVHVKKAGSGFVARARCQVQEGDPSLVQAYVKAVTLHNFYVKKTGNGWEARVVVDM